MSPSQASVETILKVDLYGTAVLLEEVGKVIRPGGTGITISSQSGHRLAALCEDIDRQLACTPTDELLNLEVLQPQNILDTLHAYQLAKRCNVSVSWQRPSDGASEAHASLHFQPGIIVTPLAIDEFNGVRGRVLQADVCQLSGTPSRHSRRSGQRGRIADEQPWSLHHRLGLPD